VTEIACPVALKVSVQKWHERTEVLCRITVTAVISPGGRVGRRATNRSAPHATKIDIRVRECVEYNVARLGAGDGASTAGYGESERSPGVFSPKLARSTARGHIKRLGSLSITLEI